MNEPKGTTKELNLTLTLDEVNLVMEGVTLLPFVKVYALVAKLQQQAQQQLSARSEGGPDVR
ncbi:hypothetical protein [Vitiosangium sp. GDMCC 1.1324]|uniref:hypothetical protein n=1 Tax=Vitiosangium sp. (strain GDMCC 1.1324) TaxID=2138576 RepID=UPI000D3BEDC3|nr:hypothetical protein [Vitiosangium sp. GDMCC 1.1324]PTL78095.1 hypothetical protein DAT35_41515 [Vitiosangium sp. GDMCC 1.1324]